MKKCVGAGFEAFVIDGIIEPVNGDECSNAGSRVIFQILQLMPEDADALMYAGDALREHGRLREAGTMYQRALRQNPGLVEAHNNFGNILMQMGRHDDAITGGEAAEANGIEQAAHA